MTKRGTPTLKLSFRGVGKIERHTGFRDPHMTARLKEMCRTLFDANREDVLRDLAAGRVTFRDVWASYRLGRWKRMPTTAHAYPFGEAFLTWAKTKKAHYQRFASWVKNAVDEPGLLNAALRERLLHYRSICESAGTGAMFNRCHDTVRAFLRDTLTTDHVLYREVASISSLPEPKKRLKNPQRPKQAWTIAQTLGGEAGRVWWELCCTGMLPDERFSEKYERAELGWHIKGTKREARDRFVPALVELQPTRLTKQQFERLLRKSGLGVRPKDGRDTFALWCDLARLPLAWKRALMGHETKGDVTVEYGAEESERIVEECGQALKRLLAPLETVDTNGDTGTGSNGVSQSAPRKTRTPSLLIRSQSKARTTRSYIAKEPEGSRTKSPKLPRKGVTSGDT